jgi:hypothetical protein
VILKENNGGKGFWKNKKKIREKYDIFRSDLPPRKIQFCMRACVRSALNNIYLFKVLRLSVQTNLK